MPKGGRKIEKKNRNIASASDVTLSDFADCSARASRLRKSAGNSLYKEVEDIRISEETLWFERDLDDFVLNPAAENRKKSNKTKVVNSDLNSRPGVQYPVDVWFLVGQFIQPEDVRAFASICKGSYFVSRTYSFWMTMYKRHYKSEVELPQRLRPECIEGSLSLKAHVIRALYHMYPLFSNQLSSPYKPSPDVCSLSNLCCTNVWRVQQNGKWLFHFKFQIPSFHVSNPVDYRVEIQNLWSRQDDEERNNEMYVNHNPDEGCKILLISCSHFVVVSPRIMNSRLSDVSINLTQDMRRQKLRLTFCYSNYCQTSNLGSKCKENGVYGNIVEFDPVENISILNWWHPQYAAVCKI